MWKNLTNTKIASTSCVYCHMDKVELGIAIGNAGPGEVIKLCHTCFNKYIEGDANERIERQIKTRSRSM